jgi:hypothetical protein
MKLHGVNRQLFQPLDIFRWPRSNTSHHGDHDRLSSGGDNTLYYRGNYFLLAHSSLSVAGTRLGVRTKLLSGWSMAILQTFLRLGFTRDGAVN